MTIAHLTSMGRRVDSWKMRHYHAQRSERRLLWGLASASSALLILSALIGRTILIDHRIPAVSKHDDAGYFEDADDLHDTEADTAGKPFSDKRLSQLPSYKRAFCGRNVQDILDKIVNKAEKDGGDVPAFTNPPGYLKFGTCWWASRFHRSAAYLMHFRPDQPKPSRDQAKRIIADIVAMREVREVGGYKTLYEFSSDFRDLAVKAVENWQVRAGLTIEPVIRGLNGPSHTREPDLGARMYALYSRLLARKDPVFQVLQIPGPETHSWLIFEARALRDGLLPWSVTGYEFTAVDPNDPDTPQQIRYRLQSGELHRIYPGENGVEVVSSPLDFVPMTAYDGDLADLRSSIEHYCKP